MAGGISKVAKQELLATIRDRHRESSKKDKGRILDEFIAVTGHHRKHGIRLLGQTGDAGGKMSMIKGRRIYDEAVREAVILAWEATGRICGKRLKAALPHLVESMERHGHLDLEVEVREWLLAASAATLDRLLKPVRSTVSGRRRRRRNLSTGRNIPVRTFVDWNRPPPGFLEIDLVAHCGDNMGGSFVYSLVATDVCTGWTEAVPLLARKQSLVVTGLEAIGRQLPFPIRGIDSDNDSVFINATLPQYCGERGIEFTRSRPYRKNDQAWIEQKNGAVIRRFIGHDRYSGPVAGQTMAHLYGAMRRYVNYFQPSFKLMEKIRNGSAVVKRYSSPTTPCDRLMRHEAVSDDAKARLVERRAVYWTRWRCCTPSGRPSRPWQRLLPRSSGLHPMARAWSNFWPVCPASGTGMKRIFPRRVRWRRLGPGAPGRTLSQGCGATCSVGCRKSRTPARLRCWAGCSPPIPIATARHICVPCSAGCSSGAASWPKNWFMARPMKLSRIRVQCRN